MALSDGMSRQASSENWFPGVPLGFSWEMCSPFRRRNLFPTPVKVNSVISAAPPDEYPSP